MFDYSPKSNQSLKKFLNTSAIQWLSHLLPLFPSSAPPLRLHLLFISRIYDITPHVDGHLEHRSPFQNKRLDPKHSNPCTFDMMNAGASRICEQVLTRPPEFVGVSGQVMCIYPHQVKEMFTEGRRLLCLLIMSLEGWCHMPRCRLPLTNPYLPPIQAELFLASVLGLSPGSRSGASVASYTQTLSHTAVFRHFQLFFVKQVISELILMNNIL